MEWSTIPGFGIAGNFTGHLEQAGESPDFTDVKTAEPTAPKGIFPFYIPSNGNHYLFSNPYSHDTIRLLNHNENHQIEPEMSILLTVDYQGTLVKKLTPTHLFAHNDCSIRRKGARKISEKKNWGMDSKGISLDSIHIDSFDSEILKHLHLGCYLMRDDSLHKYGITSPVCNYSYFHQQLLDWMVNQFNSQTDQGPLEDLQEWLQIAKQPSQILVSIGATKYTVFGQTNFLRPQDTSIVVLYDDRQFSEERILEIAKLDVHPKYDGLAILKQSVV